jgi:hypothetical protein
VKGWQAATALARKVEVDEKLFDLLILTTEFIYPVQGLWGSITLLEVRNSWLETSLFSPMQSGTVGIRPENDKPF